MDGPDRRPDADVDHITYGEVILARSKDDTMLAASDWRVPAAPPVPPVPPRRAPKRARANPRSTTLREERDRARTIVAESKTVIQNTFDAVRFGTRIETATLTPLIDAIAQSIERNPIAIPSVTRLKTRSEYTYLHSVAVCGLMMGLARELGLDPALTQTIGLAGMLHDVGKAVVPRMLIDKPGPLTDDEFAIMKLHPQRGFELLSDSPDIPDLVRDVVLHHHERIDGTGYPRQLGGSEQSIFVRMATICDVYDAVTSVRAYKERWSPGAAINWMRSTRGHFDPAILGPFITMLGAFPPGTLVRLSSDRLAIVLDVDEDEALNPTVLVFHSATTDRPVTWRRISSSNDPILCIEQPDAWHFPDWPTLADALMAFGV